MADEILSISKEELENSLINMLLESAEESFSLGSPEDAIDYVSTILSLYPEHHEANRLLELAKEEREHELIERLWVQHKIAEQVAGSVPADWQAKKVILEAMGLWEESSEEE